MKPVVLDTDIVSYFLRGDALVFSNISQYLDNDEDINITSITFYEILNGLYYKDAKRQLENFLNFSEVISVLPFSKESAKVAAQISTDLKKQGQFIGHNDILIAGTTIENNMTLITNNTNHFSRISNLKIENWSK